MLKKEGRKMVNFNDTTRKRRNNGDGGPISKRSNTAERGNIALNEVKSMPIDGVQKEIRFYGEITIVFVDWDEPRELTFQDDGARRVTFNDRNSYVLRFNQPYQKVPVNGTPRYVRLGAPGREIFVDGVPYECLFGDASIRIHLDGVPTTVKLEGPPPPIKIGNVRRVDLVAGKINLSIDSKMVVPVFLDARVQRFILDGQLNNLKFVNALQSVLINGVLFDVEYGGLPKPIVIRGKKHFVRFSVLPKGVRPGRVRIRGMEERAGVFGGGSLRAANEGSRNPALDRNFRSPNTFNNILQQQNLNKSEFLSNAMTIPRPTMPTRCTQVENQPEVQGSSSDQPQDLPAMPSLNAKDLFQKLVASGLITSSGVKKPDALEAPIEKVVTKKSPKKTAAHPDPSMAPSQNVALQLKKTADSLRPVTFERPEQLRTRQRGLLNALISGKQCSNCGMRFAVDASVQYSQHLDWHFRKNRRDKRNSRPWNYSLGDWENYEELEDLEERGSNFFDQQKQAAEQNKLKKEVPSVATDPNFTAEFCAACHDEFDQFFNEEEEEWQLSNAVRMDEKPYHPICYEDYQKSLLDETAEESKIESVEVKQKHHMIPGLDIIVIDDDEDDEERRDDSNMPEAVSLKNDEVPDDKETRSAAPAPKDGEENDDDVILNEVAPITIVIDDDDEDMPSEEVSSDPESVKVKRDSLPEGFVETSSVSLRNGKEIKIKSEFIDLDDEQLPPTAAANHLPSATPDPPVPRKEAAAPAPHINQVSSIDGNLELPPNPIVAIPTNMSSANRIRINISKPMPVISKEMPVAETIVDAPELLPTSEEPKPTALKPALRGVQLRKLPPVLKGKEVAGVCSIM